MQSPRRGAGGYGRRVPDPIFAHPRLAAIYDAFDGERADLIAYLDIAEELDARRVLDVGCGTGSLAVLLAERGYSVVAIDPAEASLAVAKAKDTLARVSWVYRDAATPPPVQADLAVMTGNVAQVFLTDPDWTRALRGVRAALRSRGHLVFETRRPEQRVWEEWAARPTRRNIDVPGVGPVCQDFAVTEVCPPLISFRYTYHFPDGAVVASDSTLRFRDRTEVEASLDAQKFDIVDVRDAPDRPDREYVFVARRRD
jgi:SAM-dependent methyltransferase